MAAGAKKSKVVSYTKWGYIFLLPFIVVYCFFSLVPLINTIWRSFTTYYLDSVQMKYVTSFSGFENYVYIFSGDLFKYFGNTMIMWIIGFIPQILISLLLGVWFADTQLKLKGEQFFKTVIYLPNLIMATAFSMLFFALFAHPSGPVNGFITALGGTAIRFTEIKVGIRGLVGLMNFLMWFGNTTIMLMAGIMGIDTSLFEAANVDGANAWQVFSKITMPLLRPIFVYVFITSMIGGLQMFDVPQILTKGGDVANRSGMTMIMWLNNFLQSLNYGRSGALSVILFIITGILSFIVFRIQSTGDEY